MDNLHFVHYLPVGSTLLSAAFLAVMLHHYFTRNRAPHILFWSIGIFTYGLGTALESAITLLGNTPELTKAWYVAGALLGGYPLAQGSVYLHLSRRTGHILTAITVPIIVWLSYYTILSPVKLDLLEAHRPSGAVLEWQWIRYYSPLINIYAVIFLIGTAAASAIKFARTREMKNRAIGNWLIVVGAILPGIGGTLAKADIVEALYIGEFVGIILIWWGYKYCMKPVAVKP